MDKIIIALSFLIFHAVSSNAQFHYYDTICVSYNKTTVLIFPSTIYDADRGTEDILIRPFDKSTNILRVKAAVKNFEPTNLTIITDDNRLYNFHVVYDSSAFIPVYHFLPIPGSVCPVVQNARGLSDFQIEEYARAISASNPAVRFRSHRQYRLHLASTSIRILDGVLFLSFSVENHSNIPFEVDFIRFYIRDRSKKRRTSYMEKDVNPLFLHFSEKSISKGGQLRIVGAFNRFTIADSKLFAIEIFERNGDRHLKTTLKGKDLLNAKTLLIRQQ